MHPDVFYDEEYDWDLIVSSFAEQYNIRLHHEYETISLVEFNRLLVGVNEKTVLGKIVTIRSETDQEILKTFGKEEHRIRKEWQKFRTKQMTKQEELQEVDNVLNMLKSMFGGVKGAGDGN